MFPGLSASSGMAASAAPEAWQQSGLFGQHQTVKRSRACDACRSAKVRCMPLPWDAQGTSCLRCAKSRKACVTSPPAGPRKKRKKAVNRVLELEKKVDLLTASLATRDGGVQVLAIENSEANAFARPKDTSTSLAPDHDDDDEEDGEGVVVADEDYHTSSTPNSSFTTDRVEHGATPVDIVQRGLISAADADRLLTRYNTHMVRHLPLVVIPSDLSATGLRQKRPMVFMAIMAAASYDEPALQRKLARELTKTYANKIMIAAEKSLDLIQALQISTAWLWMPDHFEELQLYQLVHMSTAMAVDLGLGCRLPERRPTPYQKHAFRHKKEPKTMHSTDPTTLEARRAWLACYYLSSNMTVMMRRPLLLTWTRFMAESYEILRSAPDRAPTDEYLCAFVWAYRLAEDVAQQIAGDDFDDPANAMRLAFSLRKVDRDMYQFRKSLPDVLVQESLAITLSVVPLYLHGATLHCDFIDGKQKEPCSSQTSPLPVSPRNPALPDAVASSAVRVGTISSCLLNIRAVTETFTAMSAEAIRSLPTLGFGRVILACAMLLKIYIFVDLDSELAAAIDKNELFVGPCIDKVIRQFQAAAADQHCRPAVRLLAVLFAIKDSFVAYCGRQEPEDWRNANDQTSRPSHGLQGNVVSASRQSWPPQQPRERQKQSLVTEAPGYADDMASARPFELPPWEVNFFAPLSVEEFAYSLGIDANEGLAESYPTYQNEPGPNIFMG